MQPHDKKLKLKFYADTPRVKNHLFTWRVRTEERVYKALRHFKMEGWTIRAAWLEITDSSGTVLSNRKIFSAKNNMTQDGLLKKGLINYPTDAPKKNASHL